MMFMMMIAVVGNDERETRFRCSFPFVVFKLPTFQFKFARLNKLAMQTENDPRDCSLFSSSRFCCNNNNQAIVEGENKNEAPDNDSENHKQENILREKGNCWR